MKIGILTYHRSHNYGALLQSIALRNVLCELGHSATFIDYWPGYHKRMYARFDWFKVCNILHPISSAGYVVNRVFAWSVINKRIKNVGQFIERFIIPYCSSVTEKYDIVVCGSDQIWRKQPEGVGYNPMYFGKNNISACKQISYAASMGILPESEKDKQEITQLVKYLSNVSVREDNLRDFLIDLGFNGISVSLDPTLLLNREQWNSLIPCKSCITGRYALFYEVANNCIDKKQMQDFCDKRGLKLVVIRTKMLWRETSTELCTVSPDIFVNLIRYSDFVFTTSFHGLAFSIIYHKQFVCSAGKKASRLVSLMDNLGIVGHFIEPLSQIPEYIPIINYKDVEEKICALRELSLKYLQNSMS